MKLTAEPRSAEKVSALRKAGRIPGVVYNQELNTTLSVDYRQFDRVFRNAGTGNLIKLTVGSETHDVLVKAVQMDKRRREPIHVDFFAVTANQPVEVAIVVDFVGEPIGVRDSKGQLDIQRREVRISVLPRHIPDGFELDISELDIGDSRHISDIAMLLPEGAELVDDAELPLVTVVPQRLSVEPAEDTGPEVEVIGEDAEEGEADEATDSEE